MISRVSGRLGRVAAAATGTRRLVGMTSELRRAKTMWFGLFTYAAALSFSTTTTRAMSTEHDYSAVFDKSRDVGIKFDNLPGFTRSVVERDHALITHESRVWSGTPGWTSSLTAHLVSPAFPMGAEFSMYLVNMEADGKFESDVKTYPYLERFVFVIEGELSVDGVEGQLTLKPDDFVFFPPGYEHKMLSNDAKLVVYERQHIASGKTPAFHHGSTSEKPNLVTPGEIFKLKKCLPQEMEYDFNIHIMDFEPGEFLNVKEVHYNQHGLLLLEGQGIYRLGERWYPVQAGDAIWMAPFVPQWYGALGKRRSRYILYKDTYRMPGTYEKK